MTDNTQDKRDLELDLYREQLTLIANGEISGLLDDDQTGVLRATPNDFAQGFEYAVEAMALWANAVLEAGETLTGPGVDMTDDERSFAEAVVARLTDPKEFQPDTP